MSKFKNLKVRKILSLSLLQKNEKVCSGENTKGMGRRSVLKRDCRCVTHESNQLPWESLGLVMGVCEVYVIRMGIYG